ncbi:hypothetical protein PFICI_08237 [Pestalotiopsis fici W106-1]|uniref:Apple domain-containing protein n=1 Tax=Pestalotiopsis fici (strain W106-1 / CGMCC3.15140) TaxID=1229662 RepID=W3X3J5_PESFW|nr:uncharacterized protein PFICI_08237 [Pestalotiopsis fici W106-1]ETS80708.1 hypothetical protein PFICI_08237 [Pestalotiopsis fici W106-1]
MQFTLATIALVASLMASEAAAKPVLFARDQVCGTTPAGTGSAQPLSSPSVSTAEDCKEAGEKISSCQSFAFGLPPNANTPICKLFSVPAAQVPAQQTNIVVFDLACTNVPTKAPTTSNPVGLLRRSQTCGATPSYSGSATPLSSPSVDTAEECKEAGAAVSSCQSFAFGLPPSADAPVCKLFSVPASQVPSQETNIEVFDIGCSDVPNTEPTEENPVGLVDDSTSSTQTKTTNTASTTSTTNTNNQDTSSSSSSNMCNTTPTGSTSNSVSPLKTNTAITSAGACLTLGKSTSGCKSVEFGKASSTGDNECRLFSVAASNIPAPTSGQSFVVYDISC